VKTALFALIALVAAATILVSSGAAAEAYDRKPVTMSSMVPDNWGSSLSQGQDEIRENIYPGAYRVACTGVFMQGYRRDSSWLRGNTLYWDKLFCIAVMKRTSARGTSFVLDPKKTRFVTYRKHTFSVPGTTSNPPPPPAAQPPPPPPPPAPSPPRRCDPNYRGACVPLVPYDLDCADIDGPVYVVGRDPHGFDGDGDGVGCEWG
jgi:hypothetical protein